MCNGDRADQCATAFGFVPFKGNWHAVYQTAGFAFGNEVFTMGCAARVGLRAIDFVAFTRDALAIDGVRRRAADDLSTMVCVIAHNDEFASHLSNPPQFHAQTWEMGCDV